MQTGTVGECIRGNLLENVMITVVIQGVEKVSELTDEQVKVWYEGVL